MQRNMIYLQACKSNILEVNDALDIFLKSISFWIDPFFNHGFLPIRPKSSHSNFAEESQLRISNVLKVEESIWSTLYGVKGKIDSTIDLAYNPPGDKGKYHNVPVPFELKTGSNSNSIAHRSQTMFYTLIMSDKYSTHCFIIFRDSCG